MHVQLRCICLSLLLGAPFVQVQAQSHTLQPDAWSLLSLTGSTLQSINELFADDFNGQGVGTVWSISVFDGQSNTYRTLNGDDRLASGQGFWMIQITDAPVVVDVPTAPAPPLIASPACASNIGCSVLPLPTGDGTRWSLIGMPFNEGVPVSELRIQSTAGECRDGCTLADAAQLGMTNGVLLAFDSATRRYQTVSGEQLMQPGVGYWFPSLLEADAGTATLLIPKPTGATLPTTDNVFTKAALLGRGINLGNALEAPTEGLWGVTLESYFFDRIADAGFDSVRVPIRWSAHADSSAPYTIDPQFFERIDWVVAQAQRAGLAVVLNMHHFEALMATPGAQRTRYLALWQQIAERYANEPDAVFFELLNEPTEQFNDQPALWNELLADAIAVVRQSNPSRALIVGPVGWNAIDRLPALRLPNDDQLIGTVHFYSPFEFTHQGATWVNPVPPLGVSFNADQTGFGGAFGDWSWDTSWAPVSDGVRISFQRQYAGFNLRKLVSGQLRTITLGVRGSAQLAVTCGNDGSYDEMGQIRQTSAGLIQHTINLSACAANSGNVVVQNQAPTASSFVLEQGEVCTSIRCHAIFESAGDALAAMLQVAADWGTENNVPMYVGEFGAYSTADMASRASWTTAVQRAIHRQGMTSAYWEFGSGFGAFRINEDRWHAPLLQALIP